MQITIVVIFELFIPQYEIYMKNSPMWAGGLVVNALDFQAGYRGFEYRSGRDNFETISTPSSYSTRPGLSIK